MKTNEDYSIVHTSHLIPHLFLLFFLILLLSLSAIVQLLGYSEKPVNLQMFIGTADDRYLRPHAFYQVHRITGKTVATASQEIIVSSTKVLEIPLLPENNMSARWVSEGLWGNIAQLWPCTTMNVASCNKNQIPHLWSHKIFTSYSRTFYIYFFLSFNQHCASNEAAQGFYVQWVNHISRHL